MNTNLFAPVLINNYIWHEIISLDAAFASRYSNVPFYPIYDNKGGNAKWDGKPYVVYDTMTIKRRQPLYVTKRENLLYSIRGTVPEILYFKDLINYIIDRQDDAGKDLNAWAGENVVNNKIYFHSFATNELNWSSEITEVQDTRQPVTKNLILEYDYHFARYHNDGRDELAGEVSILPQPFFNWTQSTPSTTWVINHNLGYKPLIQVFEVGGTQMDALAVHTSNVQTTVYFTSPTAGYARLV